MKPIIFVTSKLTYQPKIVADINIPVMAFLGRPTIDGRKLLPPGRAQIMVRLPANIMTDHAKGPLRPGANEIVRFRMIGALMRVTIEADRVSAAGVLYELLDPDLTLWPGVDLDGSMLKFYKNGRCDFLEWKLIGVTLRNYGPVWTDMPPVTITPR